MSKSSVPEQNTLKRVRFEELNHTPKMISSLKSKEKTKTLINEEIMLQLDRWSSAITTKSKRDKRQLYKGASENLFKNLLHDFDQTQLEEAMKLRNHSGDGYFDLSMKHYTSKSQSDFSNVLVSKLHKNSPSILSINESNTLPSNKSSKRHDRPHFIHKSFFSDSSLTSNNFEKNYLHDGSIAKKLIEKSPPPKKANNISTQDLFSNDCNGTNYIPQSYYFIKLQNETKISHDLHHSTKYVRESQAIKSKSRNSHTANYGLHELKLMRSNNRLTKINNDRMDNALNGLKITPIRESGKPEFFSNNLSTQKKVNFLIKF